MLYTWIWNNSNNNNDRNNNNIFWYSQDTQTQKKKKLLVLRLFSCLSIIAHITSLYMLNSLRCSTLYDCFLVRLGEARRKGFYVLCCHSLYSLQMRTAHENYEFKLKRMSSHEMNSINIFIVWFRSWRECELNMPFQRSFESVVPRPTVRQVTVCLQSTSINELDYTLRGDQLMIFNQLPRLGE